MGEVWAAHRADGAHRSRFAVKALRQGAGLTPRAGLRCAGAALLARLDTRYLAGLPAAGPVAPWITPLRLLAEPSGYSRWAPAAGRA